MRKCEYGALIAREYEKTLKNERKNTIRIASKEGYVLNKFKKKKKKSRNIEITESSSLSMFYIKDYFKRIKLACKTSGNNFKYGCSWNFFYCYGTISMFMKLLYDNLKWI